MGITDKIELFIIELLKRENYSVELKRNELASVFNCVPSQINYVIATRFRPEQGYIIESRRGGGGYVKITCVRCEDDISAVMDSVGDAIDFQTAYSLINTLYTHGGIDKTTADIILSCITDNTLSIQQPYRDSLRAAILKTALNAYSKNN